MQPFNKYYPPDYDGKSNINKMAGTHALGRRAHKLNQGILIVRFELPFNIWCGSCHQHIGQGVRFNAEKKRAGSFYSTPIWSFRMKCHLCSAWFEIKTDPENTRYVIVDGAKKQTEDEDTADQAVAQPKGLAGEKKPEDPFAQLEKDEEDKVKASAQHQMISSLYDLSERQWSDPWAQSQKLRKHFRQEKKILNAKSTAAEEIRNRNGLHINLLPESEQDAVHAKTVEFHGREGRDAALHKRELRNGALVIGKKGRGAETKRQELERAVKLSTRERADPFLNHRLLKADAPSLGNGVKVVKKRAVAGSGGKAIVGFANGYSSDEE